MFSTRRRIHRGAALAVLISLLGFGMPLRAVAQTGGPDGTPTPTKDELRAPAAPAPDRPPVLLETQTLSSGAVASIVELAPVADAYLASERPEQNFGLGALFLGYNLNAADNFGAQRVLLRFDVSSQLPGNIVVHDARLRLYMTLSDPATDAPMGTVLRASLSPWNETTVTWSGEPTWGAVRAQTSVGSAPGWYEWNITGLVTDWAQGTLTNYGLEIIGDENVQQRERAFYGRETTTGLHPRLVVNYSVVNDNLPPIITVNGLPAFSGRSFTVSWGGADQGNAGLDHYDVQYRVDNGAWVDWVTNSTSTSAEFNGGQNGRTYAFRARGVDRVGNVEAYGEAEAQTTVDTRPPSAQVQPLPAITNANSFTVRWTGNDGGGSGIQYYDVRYRFNAGAWTPWQTQTLATEAIFTAMADGVYEFEARAVDNLGLSEAFTNLPEAGTAVDVAPPFIAPVLWLPLVFR